MRPYLEATLWVRGNPGILQHQFVNVCLIAQGMTNGLSMSYSSILPWNGFFTAYQNLNMHSVLFSRVHWCSECGTPTSAFAEAKQTQWTAFHKRLAQTFVSDDFKEIILSVERFLGPVAAALLANEQVPQKWPATGPWVWCTIAVSIGIKRNNIELMLSPCLTAYHWYLAKMLCILLIYIDGRLKNVL